MSWIVLVRDIWTFNRSLRAWNGGILIFRLLKSTMHSPWCMPIYFVQPYLLPSYDQTYLVAKDPTPNSHPMEREKSLLNAPEEFRIVRNLGTQTLW